MLNCKTATLRILVYVFNTLIFLCGAVILGLGIWVMVDKKGLQMQDTYIVASVGILIGCGALVMLTSFLGCFACSNKSKPGVVIYCILLMIVIMLKVAGCVVLLVYYTNTSRALFNNYKQQYPGDPLVKEMWDSMQSMGSCCGLEKYWDWENSAYYNSTGNFPQSCCTLDGNGVAVNLVACQNGNPTFLHTLGCDAMLRTYYYAISATTVVVILIEIVAAIWIICLYQHIP